MQRLLMVLAFTSQILFSNLGFAQDMTPEEKMVSLGGALTADYDRKLSRVQNEIEQIINTVNTLPRSAICVKVGAMANTALASVDTVVILNAIGLRSKNGGKMFLQPLGSSDYVYVIENFCHNARLPKTELVVFLQEHLEKVIYPARSLVATVETGPVSK